MLVEILRNKTVESKHHICAQVVKDNGEILFKSSETFAFFPRSAIKPFQSHLLLESGAFKAFGLGLNHLAVASASHAGEKIHTDLVSSWLRKIKLDSGALNCGAHWPYDARTSDELKENKLKPNNLHNNCSGKHTGMLSVCTHKKIAVENYHLPDHPLQQMLKTEMERLLDQDLNIYGIDGCSLPAFEMDFYKVGKNFAGLAARAVEDSNSSAGLVFRAFKEHPVLTSGTELYCYQLMHQNQGRLLAKEGAEGVVVAAIPEKKIAILVKVEDGTKRAAQAAMDFLVQKYSDLKPAFNKEITNWAGTITGQIRVNDKV